MFFINPHTKQSCGVWVNFMDKNQTQKGIALYIVIMLLTVFMTVVLALTSVSLSQIRVSWQSGDSIKAFGAADSGIEEALYMVRKLGVENNTTTDKTDLTNESSYVVDIVATNQTATIQSKGVFRKVRRVIEAKY